MPATKVKTGAMTFPASLGKILPGGTTACVPLTQNIIPTKIDNNGNEVQDNYFNGIWIQASPTNGGMLYVCNSAAAPDLTNYTNVIGALSAGQWYPRTKEWANNRDISTLFIGAENATDFAIVSIDQF